MGAREKMKTKILGKPGEPSFYGDINQCPTCFEVFNSTYAFDKHRVGSFEKNTRRCLTEDEMKAIGMATNKKDRWVSSLMETNVVRNKGE
jgi:hypothetical protein